MSIFLVLLSLLAVVALVGALRDLRTDGHRPRAVEAGTPARRG